jgi:hypothetical protein
VSLFWLVSNVDNKLLEDAIRESKSLYCVDNCLSVSLDWLKIS